MLDTAVFTVLALIAFAANSLLCRLALTATTIDPASFTTVRLVTGAGTLLALIRFRAGAPSGVRPSWTAAALLALYAVPFAFAYRQVTTATGALLLFAAVQFTMILGGGRRPTAGQWWGLALSSAGLVYFVLPGLAAPAPVGAALMLLAGLSWGLYSLRGQASADPLAQTASNFLRAIPWAVALSLLARPAITPDLRGIGLAALSGGLASGLGYVAWYRALPRLPAIVASMVQLIVPPLAALGGLVVLGEPVSPRLLLASTAILGGIALALRPAPPRPRS